MGNWYPPSPKQGQQSANYDLQCLSTDCLSFQWKKLQILRMFVIQIALLIGFARFLHGNTKKKLILKLIFELNFHSLIHLQHDIHLKILFPWKYTFPVDHSRYHIQILHSGVTFLSISAPFVNNANRPTMHFVIGHQRSVKKSMVSVTMY